MPGAYTSNDHFAVSRLASDLDDYLSTILDGARHGEAINETHARQELAGAAECLLALVDPLQATEIDPQWSVRIPPALISNLVESPGPLDDRASLQAACSELRSDQPLSAASVAVLKGVSAAVTPPPRW